MPLSEPVPDLSALDLLVSVADLGSISAAAGAHRVTQPAASMRLRTLERSLGVQLLERGPTGSRLTPAGAATVQWAGSVLTAVSELIGGVAALRSDKASQLHLAASLTVAEYLIPTWLRQLGATDPNLAVSLEMGNTSLVTDLVSRDAVDLGFVEGPDKPRALRSRPVVEDELVVVVGRSHPWSRRRTPLVARTLAATPLILREPGSGTRGILDAALARHALTARPLMELGSTTAIKSAAISGVGPAVVSALAVQSELRTGELLRIPVAGLELTRTIRAVWSPARQLPEPAARLLAIVA